MTPDELINTVLARMEQNDALVTYLDQVLAEHAEHEQALQMVAACPECKRIVLLIVRAGLVEFEHLLAGLLSRP